MTDFTHRAARGRTPGTLGLLILAIAVFAGCASSGGSRTPVGARGGAVSEGGKMAAAPSTKEPEHIQVQHILIGFAGSVPGKTITRTQEEARALAYQVLERARAGEDFDKLVRENTDDQWPGVYGMSNTGVSPTAGKEYGRNQMVPAFGDVGFTLAVGEIGIADYDPVKSPFGFHVIKRVQ